MKYLILLASALLIIKCSMAQSPFRKVYGTAATEIFYAMQKTNDGGYAMAGVGWGFTTNGICYLLKTDRYGDTVWTSAWGNIQDVSCEGQFATGFSQLEDSGFIVASHKFTCDSSGKGQVSRLDKNGNVLWQKYFAPWGASPYNAIEDNAGNFLVCGYYDGLLLLMKMHLL
jgi:hypothetical protein